MKTYGTILKTVFQIISLMAGLWILWMNFYGVFDWGTGTYAVLNRRILVFIGTLLIGASVALILEPEKWKLSLAYFIITVLGVNLFFILFGSSVGLMDAATQGVSPNIQQDIWIVYNATTTGLWGINLQYVASAVTIFVAVFVIVMGVLMIYYSDSPGEFIEAAIEMFVGMGALWIFAQFVYPNISVSLWNQFVSIPRIISTGIPKAISVLGLSVAG